MWTRCLVVLAALAPAACDTKAQPAAAAGSPSVEPGRLSAEHESCGTTAHCAEGLRCFDQTCTRSDRSLLGDYYAALGGRRRAAGDLAAAREAYGEAVKYYGIEKLTLPADIECAYGGSLAADETDEANLQIAAKALHRCVAATPAGSPIRARALHEVAVLHDFNLDPAHLVRDDPSDRYLSRAGGAPVKPKDVGVTVAASPEPKKNWPELQAMIQAAPGLKECFDAAFKATKSKVLIVGVPFKSIYKVDPDYPDDGGKWVTGIDAKAPPPTTDGDRCVRDAVAAVTKGMKAISDWDATVTVTIQ